MNDAHLLNLELDPTRGRLTTWANAGYEDRVFRTYEWRDDELRVIRCQALDRVTGEPSTDQSDCE
jgi:hypothetical protein